MKNLRVYIEKDKHEIYENLVKRGSENPDSYPFQTMKDLFMAATCFGFQNNSFEEVKSSRDIFNSDVFDEKIDIPVLAVIAYYKDKDLSILNDDRRILEIAQGYANGGIPLLKDQIVNNPGRPLNNFIEIILNENI